MAIGIRLRVLPDTDVEATKVMDTLTRVATGLAFDGIGCDITFTPYDPEED